MIASRSGRRLRSERLEMTAESELVETITHSREPVKRGSLVFFGDIFGGKLDNVHRVVSAYVNPDASVGVDFDGGEVLTVWTPEGIQIDSTQFIIRKASRVRWEWFYYGRPPTDANRLFIDYVRRPDGIKVTTNFGHLDHRVQVDRPAVLILKPGEESLLEHLAVR
jgi:hypothetical protein